MKNSQRTKSFDYAAVGESPVAGKGVFAVKDIEARTRVGFFEGRPGRRHSKFALTLEDGSILRITNAFRFLNHSDRANIDVIDTGSAIELTAKRSIKKGRELFIDYGPEFRQYIKELKNL